MFRLGLCFSAIGLLAVQSVAYADNDYICLQFAADIQIIGDSDCTVLKAKDRLYPDVDFHGTEGVRDSDGNPILDPFTFTPLPGCFVGQLSNGLLGDEPIEGTAYSGIIIDYDRPENVFNFAATVIKLKEPIKGKLYFRDTIFFDSVDGVRENLVVIGSKGKLGSKVRGTLQITGPAYNPFPNWEVPVSGKICIPEDVFDDDWDDDWDDDRDDEDDDD